MIWLYLNPPSIGPPCSRTPPPKIGIRLWAHGPARPRNKACSRFGFGATASSSASFRRECPALGVLKLHLSGEPEKCKFHIILGSYKILWWIWICPNPPPRFRIPECKMESRHFVSPKTQNLTKTQETPGHDRVDFWFLKC